MLRRNVLGLCPSSVWARDVDKRAFSGNAAKVQRVPAERTNIYADFAR